VQTAEGERETRACGRQRLESERRQNAGRSAIPWIRNDERRAGVQGVKIESLLALPVHGRQVYSRRSCGACGGEVATGVMRTSCLKASAAAKSNSCSPSSATAFRSVV